MRRPADVRVYTDEAGVTELYAIMARDNHSFAKFNKIGLDQDGNPDPDDLQLAWAGAPGLPADAARPPRASSMTGNGAHVPQWPAVISWDRARRGREGCGWVRCRARWGGVCGGFSL